MVLAQLTQLQDQLHADLWHVLTPQLQQHLLIQHVTYSLLGVLPQAKVALVLYQHVIHMHRLLDAPD